MTRPCAIPNCPALTIQASSYCAIHDAMSAAERRQAKDDAERARFKLPQLKPVTTRIDYE